MYKFEFTHKDKIPLFKQIAEYIINDFEGGVIEKDFQLSSINQVNKHYSIARDTIERAYKELKNQEYVVSAAGKGYYFTGKKNCKIKVLLILNTWGHLESLIYNSFHSCLCENGEVDLQINPHSQNFLKEVIDKNVGKYDYYAILPHFYCKGEEIDILNSFRKIPSDKLLLIDRNLPNWGINICLFSRTFK